MEYDLIPLGTKVLLKRTELEVSEKDKETPSFVFQHEAKADLEYFKVIAIGKGCQYSFHVGDTVVVETYTPIGFFNDEQLFISDERFISCRILPKTELTTRK